MELVWRYQDTEQDKAALAEFEADGPELARLIGEFGTLLLADYITAVPDEHADCESAYALRRPVSARRPSEAMREEQAPGAGARGALRTRCTALTAPPHHRTG
ncbi:hypothetical protein [Streptomyces sp. SAJ15]|uniref:hypothetical protein n=1 Tax=Streptomyces sp. SAJ15 TaxID=2011095 RepID=UPI001186B6CC|nr:hypothetical protein [Streptomyces sp. SAJ15]TVL87348.1 hypothetical protein CD790_33675 [Streptomyces sp. SAJ15]